MIDYRLSCGASLPIVVLVLFVQLVSSIVRKRCLHALAAVEDNLLALELINVSPSLIDSAKSSTLRVLVDNRILNIYPIVVVAPHIGGPQALCGRIGIVGLITDAPN